MTSVATQLKELRQQVERLQVEISGRRSIEAMVVWDEQNQSSVNRRNSGIPENFAGLVIHLTPELSPPVETSAGGESGGLDDNEFEELRKAIVRTLGPEAGGDVAGTGAGTSRRTFRQDACANGEDPAAGIRSEAADGNASNASATTGVGPDNSNV